MTTKKLMVFVAAAASLAAIGCGSSSSCADGAVCVDGGTGGAGGGGGGGSGGTLFALTPGTFCFDITAIAPGSADGCGIDVAGQVGTAALPVTYDATAGTVEVGTDGSLGIGAVANNKATLLRDGNTSDGASCTWHQMDTSMFTLTADNTFTLAVTENETMFGAACGATAPAGGMCTSTWTWTMKIDGSVAAPGCK